MAIVGIFAGELFEVSDTRVFTPTGMNREESARWTDHEVMKHKPVSEFIGPALGKISLQVKLSQWFIDDILKEMDKWLSMVRAGTVGTLIIGKPLGVDQWKLTNITQDWSVIGADGKPMSAVLDVTFEEYISVLY